MLLSIELISAHLKVIIFSTVLCWKLCVLYACTHAWDVLCVYAWVCKVFVLYLSIYCGTWTLLFPTDMEAFRKEKIFIFESCKNLIQVQFHPVCIIHRLMVSCSLRDTLQVSDGKMPPHFPLIMDLSFIYMKEWKSDMSIPKKEVNFHLKN